MTKTIMMMTRRKAMMTGSSCKSWGRMKEVPATVPDPEIDLCSVSSFYPLPFISPAPAFVHHILLHSPRLSSLLILALTCGFNWFYPLYHPCPIKSETSSLNYSQIFFKLFSNICRLYFILTCVPLFIWQLFLFHAFNSPSSPLNNCGTHWFIFPATNQTQFGALHQENLIFVSQLIYFHDFSVFPATTLV